jgi:hypothetical protein
VIHGPIATNILNVYSMSVTALAMDIRVPRHVLALAVGVLATAFTTYLVFADSVAEIASSGLRCVGCVLCPHSPRLFILGSGIANHQQDRFSGCSKTPAAEHA